MTHDEARGQAALQMLDKYVLPHNFFIGSDGLGARLYELEEKRTKIIQDCAEHWSKIGGVPKEEFWTRAVPQVLHDTLESYQAECAIVACEVYLKRLGWHVERPVVKLEKAG